MLLRNSSHCLRFDVASNDGNGVIKKRRCHGRLEITQENYYFEVSKLRMLLWGSLNLHIHAEDENLLC